MSRAVDRGHIELQHSSALPGAYCAADFSAIFAKEFSPGTLHTGRWGTGGGEMIRKMENQVGKARKEKKEMRPVV